MMVTNWHKHPKGDIVFGGWNDVTVTVTNILICTWDEYQANKTLLDGIGYFTGNTMPLA